MKLKNAIKFMALLFCILTTAQVLFVGAINMYMDNNMTMTMQDLLRFPLISFAAVLPTLIFVRNKAKNRSSRIETFLFPILHFTLTAGIVFGLLIYFGWMDASNAIIMVAFFLAIYVPAYAIQEIRDRKLAKRLNEKIDAFHNSENATRADEP